MSTLSELTAQYQARLKAREESPKTTPKLEKLVLVALECDLHVIAQYNPKEVAIEKSVNWSAGANSKDDRPQLTFSSVAARTLSIELMFDTYEDEIDVQLYVGKLMRMASVIEQDGNIDTEQDRRPTLVQVAWGDPEMPIFRGVIQSLSTKLTMFLPNGMPVRATCGIKLMEASGDFKGGRKRPPRPPTRW
jgi:hypothetical protein